MRLPVKTLHYVAGPEPTAEQPLPVGMVFTSEQIGGVFLAEVDPVTLKGGRPQRFRVKGKNESGDIELEPVFEQGGRFVRLSQVVRSGR